MDTTNYQKGTFKQRLLKSNPINSAYRTQHRFWGRFPAKPQFDYIVSNPPYVAQSELETLAREIRDFEPQQALIAGPLGSEIYQRLIPQAAERLRPGGALIIEIGPAVHQAILTLVNHSDQFTKSYLVKDLADLPRVIVAKKA